ncbi:hypothetical protein PORY_002039 [Pneumocystis oryctolagi]|uniref:Uncharacterized protein n=1 Tax=Pneumocystis oryctolagi TaxID=42067 RepID=A0ACB7CAR9_9ASCO|nr:hypothetical protein PORY_002039 [Pneumocystis oryctolagi]
MNYIETLKSENLDIKELYRQTYTRKNRALECEHRGDIFQAILIYQSILKTVEQNLCILKKSPIWCYKKSEKQMKEIIEMYYFQAESKVSSLSLSVQTDPELFKLINNESLFEKDDNNFWLSENTNSNSKEIGEYFSFFKKIQQISNFQKQKDNLGQSLRISSINKNYFLENLFKSRNSKKETSKEYFSKTKKDSQLKQFPQTLRQMKSRSSLAQSNAGKAALHAWNSNTNPITPSSRMDEINENSFQRLRNSTVQSYSSLSSTPYKTSLSECREHQTYSIPNELQSNHHINPYYINKNDLTDDLSDPTFKQYSAIYKTSTPISPISASIQDSRTSVFRNLYHTSHKNISPIPPEKSIQQNSSLGSVYPNTLKRTAYRIHEEQYANIDPIKNMKYKNEITLVDNGLKNISLESQNRVNGTSTKKQEETREQRAIRNLKGTIDENLLQTIMNDIVIKGDEVLWDDIAGLEEVKNTLKETVIYPLLRPDLFNGLREPATGVLLFGPPGTGKTMLAKATATQAKSTFFSISASSLTSKFLGESEKLVRALFALAKELSPSIIFVDEIDALLSSRKEDGNEHEASRRLKTEFLIQWSSLAAAVAGKEGSEPISRVLVLAATNIPWSIDEAARRRFVRRQYIPLPERNTRMQQFLYLLKYQTHTLSDEDIETLVDVTEGYSGSDITALTKDAAMGPLRCLGEALLTTRQDLIRPICMDDFKASLRAIRPSVSQKGLIEFEKFNKEFGIQN